MAFVKLDCGILDSTLWVLDSDTCKIFLTMLAMSDHSGLCRATAPGISRRANLPSEVTKASLLILESPDPDSRSQAEEGRRIRRVDGGYELVNYQAYRACRDEDERRGYMREYMARRREGNPLYGRGKTSTKTTNGLDSGKHGKHGKHGLAVVSQAGDKNTLVNPPGPPPHTQYTPPSKPPDAERSVKAHRVKNTRRADTHDPEFDGGWQARPRRSGADSKQAAYRAWCARRKEGVDAEIMLAGLQRYFAWCEAAGKSGTEYVMQTATFLGPDRHFDEPWAIENGKNKAWKTGVYE